MIHLNVFAFQSDSAKRLVNVFIWNTAKRIYKDTEWERALNVLG